MLPTFLLDPAKDTRNLFRTLGNGPVRVGHRFKPNGQHFAPEFLINFLQDERHVDPVAYRSRYKPQKIRQFSGGSLRVSHVRFISFRPIKTVRLAMVDPKRYEDKKILKIKRLSNGAAW
jgi:hypothetical protein